jgi:ribosome-associated protein
MYEQYTLMIWGGKGGLITSEERAVKAANAAADKKAEDILILDLKKISLIADYFIICSGRSTTQVQAIADNIEESLAKTGNNSLRREGYHQAQWILLDFGDVIVHVFLEEVRRFYDLERLWGDAPAVNGFKNKQVTN